MRAALTLPLLGMAVLTLGAMASQILRRGPLAISLPIPPRLPLPVRKELPDRLREVGW